MSQPCMQPRQRHFIGMCSCSSLLCQWAQEISLVWISSRIWSFPGSSWDQAPMLWLLCKKWTHTLSSLHLQDLFLECEHLCLSCWQYNACSALWSSLLSQTCCRMLKHTSLSHASLTVWEHFTDRCELLLWLQVMMEIAPVFWPGQHPPPYLFSSTLPRENMLLFHSLLLRSEHSLQVSSSHIPRHWFSRSATRYLHCSQPTLHILLTRLLLSHR